MEAFADKPVALRALFGFAFVEASVFPLPPDILLIAIALAQPRQAFRAAWWCTLGSVLGGLLGYLIGYGFMQSVGSHIIAFYQAQAAWDQVVRVYTSEIGVWFLAAAAFSPIPYKVATIAAGATQMPLLPFLLVSAIGRAGRFFLVGALLYWFGPPVKAFLDRYFNQLSLLFVLLLLVGFVAIRWFF